ncbi:MAG TPA: leucine--tRNA ligase [Gammaproteobacteria bacterium]|nr:leucine--tRNA ligase [Gammaproteobacteria bacterium]
MDEHYLPAQLEPEIQARWDQIGVFKAIEMKGRDKFYCLSMFPYPSGKLHMGHVRNYTIGDVIARYQWMQGKNVLQPMGWDAFGLPAENAALDNRVPPARWTYENIDYMRSQLKRLGFGYDWSREITTCRPEYYRWEQWFFTRLLEQGLVYKKTAVVNWDPVDQTVLANEQVIDGRGWRSGAPVERRSIPQWFLRISAYADELLEGLERLPGWPEAVRIMQRNWIGRSEGIEAEFAVVGQNESLIIFTTRPDTIMGVTYLAVAPEHSLATQAAARDPKIAAFLKECQHTGLTEAELETMEKKGLPLGIEAIHPISGERLPVWVANFVLMGYGTGAVMAVPAHDQRDFEFAHRYGLPIRPVVHPTDGREADLTQAAFVEKGVLKYSGRFDGLTSEAAFAAIANHLERHGKGYRKVNYRLRDWGVSRQRYWGCPIPIIHCPGCGAVPVPDQQLPVVLPEDVEFEGVGSPLKKLPMFYQTTCPRCGGPAERETDTFDTFFESSWYYARYCCADNHHAMLDSRAEYWLPVDQYIGGIEHAVMHLLYARFFHKLMRDLGLVKGDEPFTRLLTQGMVVAETYYRLTEGGKKEYFNPAEVTVERDAKGRIIAARLRQDGQPVELGSIEKMSKSKNNGVDPQALIERYGADTVRLFMMFAAPPEQSLEWSEAGVEGAFRFLKRFWRLIAAHLTQGVAQPLNKHHLTPAQRDLRRLIHQTIAKVNDDIGRRYTFNTAIAAVMELSNTLARADDTTDQGRAVVQEGLETAIVLLSPIVPHIAETLWAELGHPERVINAAWPQADPEALLQEEITFVVQVNGKKRATISVAVNATPEDIKAMALRDTHVQRFIADKVVKNWVVVPGRLVNIVV